MYTTFNNYLKGLDRLGGDHHLQFAELLLGLAQPELLRLLEDGRLADAGVPFRGDLYGLFPAKLT